MDEDATDKDATDEDAKDLADCPAMSLLFVFWHKNPNENKLSWAIN